MSTEAIDKARAALIRMKRYGDTFAYRSNEQNPYEQVCEAIAAIDALAERPAQPQQETDLALREATQIATWIWKNFYKDTAPQWEVLPDLRGVLSQIDNMVAGLKYDSPESKPLTGWIAVSDRLPAEADGEVLVRMRDGRCEIAWATYWHGASNGFAQWTFRDPDEEEAPTHWMPIPAAHGIKGDAA